MKKRSSKNGAKFNGKIKTEHTILEGLYDLLQEMVKSDFIHSIIPGRIKIRGSSTPKPTINLTIPTTSGWKAIGKCKGVTQELFIVTNQPDEVADFLVTSGISPKKPK